MAKIENPKNYSGRDLETIFFRPMLSGPDARALGIKVMYNTPDSHDAPILEARGRHPAEIHGGGLERRRRRDEVQQADRAVESQGRGRLLGGRLLQHGIRADYRTAGRQSGRSDGNRARSGRNRAVQGSHSRKHPGDDVARRHGKGRSAVDFRRLPPSGCSPIRVTRKTTFAAQDSIRPAKRPKSCSSGCGTRPRTYSGHSSLRASWSIWSRRTYTPATKRSSTASHSKRPIWPSRTDARACRSGAFR